MAKKLAFDKLLFTTVVLLLIFGLVMVYSASAAVARDKGVTFNPFLVKQAAAAALGLVAMAAAMHFDYRRLRRGWMVYGSSSASSSFSSPSSSSPSSTALAAGSTSAASRSNRPSWRSSLSCRSWPGRSSASPTA